MPCLGFIQIQIPARDLYRYCYLFLHMKPGNETRWYVSRKAMFNCTHRVPSYSSTKLSISAAWIAMNCSKCCCKTRICTSRCQGHKDTDSNQRLSSLKNQSKKLIRNRWRLKLFQNYLKGGEITKLCGLINRVKQIILQAKLQVQ